MPRLESPKSGVVFARLVAPIPLPRDVTSLEHFHHYIADLSGFAPPAGVLMLLCSVVVGLAVAKFLAFYLYRIFFVQVEQTLVRRLRDHLFSHLQGLSLDVVQRYRQGELISRHAQRLAHDASPGSCGQHARTTLARRCPRSAGIRAGGYCAVTQIRTGRTL